MDWFGVVWRLGATLFFVFLNGFFVAAEFALVKVREARIDELAREGRPAARAARHVLSHLDRYLSACQLGITLASLALGALGEPAVSQLLLASADWLGLGIPAEAAWLPIVSIGLAFTVITVLHMTVGEQAPKLWALRRAESTVLQVAFPLRLFTVVFGPFIAVINRISNAILRAAGLPADQRIDSSATTEELRGILALSARAGHISERERELAENVFRMMELEVRHIVVPRVDVEFLSLQRPLAESLEVIRRSGYTRFPLCEVGLDTLVGFVHARDVMEEAMQGRTPDLRALAREALFVPDTMALSDFLLELQRGRAHCAAVLDEHGTAVGLAYREDALEAIVGPLGDEFDDQSPTRRGDAGRVRGARPHAAARGLRPPRARARRGGGRGDHRRPRRRAPRAPPAQGRRRRDRRLAGLRPRGGPPPRPPPALRAVAEPEPVAAEG